MTHINTRMFSTQTAENMIAETLDQMSRIGLDFDGTLFDGRHSDFLQQYIIDNPNKTFDIVTFRSTRKFGEDSIRNIPAVTDSEWFNHIRHIHYYDGHYDPFHWHTQSHKSITCRYHNLQVIVDDLPLAGHLCTELGVTFVEISDKEHFKITGQL